MEFGRCERLSESNRSQKLIILLPALAISRLYLNRQKSACFSNLTTAALSVSGHFEGHLLLLGTINIIKKADFVGTTNYQNTAQFSELC